MKWVYIYELVGKLVKRATESTKETEYDLERLLTTKESVYVSVHPWVINVLNGIKVYTIFNADIKVNFSSFSFKRDVFWWYIYTLKQQLAVYPPSELSPSPNSVEAKKN